ncbi:CRISPR-associated endonuclease Cas2 [Caryophanon latum]|uniref:CRISPR-associated endoribonuclease Cas2 n=2 Tax=Caryophanon latum TaxID=33977 RepID=A0A1C0YPD0_9BACL|nr:CRISPR-associated endonuclease Cas2 [Caryophanon latum]
MRLLVMFDLPVTTATDRKNYRKFRKFLQENGYAMLQYSVYSKIVLNHSALQFQKSTLYENLPKAGHVDMLLITEKQFANMERFNKPQRVEEHVMTIERIIEL